MRLRKDAYRRCAEGVAAHHKLLLDASGANAIRFRRLFVALDAAPPTTLAKHSFVVELTRSAPDPASPSRTTHTPRWACQATTWWLSALARWCRKTGSHTIPAHGGKANKLGRRRPVSLRQTSQARQRFQAPRLQAARPPPSSRPQSAREQGLRLVFVNRRSWGGLYSRRPRDLLHRRASVSPNSFAPAVVE